MFALLSPKSNILGLSEIFEYLSNYNLDVEINRILQKLAFWKLVMQQVM